MCNALCKKCALCEDKFDLSHSEHEALARNKDDEENKITIVAQQSQLTKEELECLHELAFHCSPMVKVAERACGPQTSEMAIGVWHER